MYCSVSGVSQYNWLSLLNPLMKVRHHQLVTPFIPVEPELSIPGSDFLSVSVEMIEPVCPPQARSRLSLRLFLSPQTPCFLVSYIIKSFRYLMSYEFVAWSSCQPSFILLFVQEKLLSTKFTTFGTIAMCKLESCLYLKIQLQIIYLVRLLSQIMFLDVVVLLGDFWNY